MSSILTNNGAMVALQTLKSINSDLLKTQSEISTGKAVGSAKDNSALWAISKVMESDVKGFKAISESLSLGESTIAVARTGAETVTDLLTQIKGKVVSAQEENVDRVKIQADIDALTAQINSVVGAAQFNGLNMLQGTEDVNILSSLDRQSDGTVAANSIEVNRQSLETDGGVFGAGTLLTDGSSGSALLSDTTLTATGNTLNINATRAAAGDFTVTLGGTAVTVAAGADTAATETALVAAINAAGIEGVTAEIDSGNVVLTSTRAFEDVTVTTSASGAGNALEVGAAASGVFAGEIAERAENITFSQTGNVTEGDGYRITIDSKSYDYIAGADENFEDVVRGLKTAVDAGQIEGVTTTVAQDDSGAWSIKIDNSEPDLSISVTGRAGGEASGGLFGLDNIDVSTNQGADAALANVETLIQNSIDAAAEFGSAQGRIEIQADFISKLTDSLKSGIGTLVDANMEEASARLQALQVQQQLGVQALSIANQAPQNILSLFR
ncbi:flagellin [Litoreibacter ponti]|uniref:Flagellin n=1 Tax=Litoreibacter ponti TaxID=1510457 RepID=A0A2T6BNF7_9RHOB|nr:flagellin [Litoreibacter ponti]PTX57582.1 flagellin [Litoreibacter ponti]